MIFQTDSEGTVRVKTLEPEPSTLFFGTGIELFAVANDTLFFTAYDSSHGRELWKSDGTTEGTVLLTDIFTGTGGSYPRDFTEVFGTLYFSADDGVHGRELWQSDGTAAGTFMVADLCSGACSSAPTNLAPWHTPSNSTLFFKADDGLHGVELWALPLVDFTHHFYLPLVTRKYS
jgi:ELWxxDGT repeat protein